MPKSVVVTTVNNATTQHLRKVNVLTAPVAGTSLPTWASIADDGHNTFETVVSVTPTLAGAKTVVVPDVTAPVITSANTASVAENATLGHALTASETVTWSLTGGADVAQFELSGSTLRWAGNGVKDFEAPNDANTDNAYVVQVTATDASANAASQTVTVTVTNVAEGYRYWRLQIDTTALPANSVNMAEVELRAVASGADQTSPGGGSITTSGNLSGTGAEWVDNNAGTVWHSSMGPNPALWRYDFGAGVAKDIVQITMTAHPGNPAYSPVSLNVQYSDNDSSWTTSWAITGQPAWSAGETRTFTKP